MFKSGRKQKVRCCLGKLNKNNTNLFLPYLNTFTFEYSKM